MYREINPDKLIAARGKRSRGSLSRSVDKAITTQDIYCYEIGRHRPSPKKLPYLLKALGVTFDDVSDPVDMSVEA